ncbi:MAG: hypothetical protein LBN97_04075 [Oscillospiraceae bacterium]|jgi:DNA mismatch repair ATPase MutS|nr:hypothetical protein [Oscillospiraceae bacterium]
MNFSLLFPNAESSRGRPAGVFAFRDLALDKICARFSQIQSETDTFLLVLSEQGLTAETITYRQEIFTDFAEKPRLLSDLRTLFGGYDSLRADWAELAHSSGGYSALKVTAAFARRTCAHFKALSQVLAEYTLNSRGLTAIREYFAKLGADSSLAEIAEIAALFTKDSAEDYTWSINAASDEKLRIIHAGVTDVSELEAESVRKRVLGIFKKKETDLGGIHPELLRNLQNEAIYELYTVLTAITGGIYEFFRGLSEELTFYAVGLRYSDWLRENGLTLTMPEIGGAIEYKALSDIYLLTETVRPIVANDFTLDASESGVLIKGANSSGKTSFLRGLGLAQSFGQAGLPVAAAFARLIPGSLFTQFSSEEKVFEKNDVAGRFEGEVQDLRGIFDAISGDSLVLLNETFQTTAYDEAAEALPPILRELTKPGARYVLVTHLPTEHFGAVRILTAENFTISDT